MKSSEIYENGLKKTVSQIEKFLIVFWMLNFVIAFEDESPIIGNVELAIGFTFKTWNIVDGSISLVMFPVFLSVSATIQKYNIKSLKYFADN